MEFKNLVITRKIGESVALVINGEVIARIGINEIKGRQVRLSLQAPDSITIVRSEQEEEWRANGFKRKSSEA